MGKFFINRPILSTSIALIIVVAGLVGIRTLPLALYPNIYPPIVQVSASFPGASADTVRTSVATPIEQELNGTPNMVYMESNCSSTGGLSLTVTFDISADPDIAAVDIQNRVKLAESRLPTVVVENGIEVQRMASFMLMLITVYSDDPRYDHAYLSNLATINILDRLKRVPGVGKVSNMASRYYAMRIWVNPDVLAGFGLTVNDLKDAIKEQNSEASLGTIGESPNENVELVLPIISKGRLESPKDFEDIILRANSNGSMIRIRDVARVELGSSGYGKSSRYDGQTGVPLGVYLLPGGKANAVDVAARVRDVVDEVSASFPKGINCSVTYDNSSFVTATIWQTGLIILQALGVVMLVIGILLRSLRSAWIALAVMPVSVVGTFALLSFAGITINLLSLMAVVLSIAFVADDTIVFIERTRRMMRTEGIASRVAAGRVWRDGVGVLLATALVLSVLFNVIGMTGGIPGRLFAEFFRTLSIAIFVSVCVTMIFTVALCGLWLGAAPAARPEATKTPPLQAALTAVTAGLLRIRFLVVAGLLGAGFLMITLFQSVPSGFLPTEDQGYIFVEMQLPDGASITRTSDVLDRAEGIFRDHPAVEHVLSLKGVSARVGETESRGHFLVILKPWDKRADLGFSAQAVIDSVKTELDAYPETLTYLFNPPAIAGLGTGGGFVVKLQDSTGRSYDEMVEVAERLMKEGGDGPYMYAMSSNMQPSIPMYRMEVNRAKAKSLGVSLKDIYGTMSTFLSGSSVNDFNMFNRVYKVYLQAEPEYRKSIQQLRQFRVKGREGAMIPLGSLVDLELSRGPGAKRRYNMFDSITIMGLPKPGVSSGEAMTAFEELAEKTLAPGMTFEWSAISFEEKRSAGQTGPVMLVAGLIAFLLLAGLFESWVAPLVLIGLLPLLVIGSLLLTDARGMAVDIYFQIGLVSAIGLAWKLAVPGVLRVAAQMRAHTSRKDAVTIAANERSLPVAMGALTFVFALLPLALSEGPGAASRAALGSASLGAGIIALIVLPLLAPVLAGTFMRDRSAKQPQGKDS